MAASGLSDHFGWRAANTAASSTAGWLMSAFSSATELIHSPPDLMTSFDRSVMRKYPSGSMVTTSPVLNQPSFVKRSAPSLLKYDDATQGPRTSSSPMVSPSQGNTLPS